MQLHVAQQLNQAVGAVTTFDLQEPSLTTDDTVMQDLAGSVKLLRTDRGLLVSVHARATVHEKCSRCLTDISCPITIDFEEEYIPVVDITTGARVRLSASEDVFRIDPDFILDLREGLRQYTLVSEPAKPLCKADCAGLCPTCGADLNGGACSCQPQSDERWEALAALRIDNNEGS